MCCYPTETVPTTIAGEQRASRLALRPRRPQAVLYWRIMAIGIVRLGISPVSLHKYPLDIIQPYHGTSALVQQPPAGRPFQNEKYPIYSKKKFCLPMKTLFMQRCVCEDTHVKIHISASEAFDRLLNRLCILYSINLASGETTSGRQGDAAEWRTRFCSFFF